MISWLNILKRSIVLTMSDFIADAPLDSRFGGIGSKKMADLISIVEESRCERKEIRELSLNFEKNRYDSYSKTQNASHSDCETLYQLLCTGQTKKGSLIAITYTLPKHHSSATLMPQGGC